MQSDTPTKRTPTPALEDRDTGPEADADAEFETEAEAAIRQSRILVVDDQAAHVHLLERLLQDEGYVNVSSTTDPRAVGALHRQHAYDLILLDLQMPGLDGFGVMAGLRADLGSRCLPVIVLTAQPAHKLQALKAGARDFIDKPFETVEVAVRIHHMLEVRGLQKRLEAHNRDLERTVRERTAALRISEARYRSLTDLAVDWYWEQNEAGQFTRLTGPVLELLGIRDAAVPTEAAETAGAADTADAGPDLWDPAERRTLTDNIQARRPFLDLLMHRRRADGSQQAFRISGEPMFDGACGFAGYRGLGVEVRTGR